MSGIETERKCTNVYSLVFCIILVSATLLLVGFCAITGNLSRVTRVHNDCGNFCGEKNTDNPYETCGLRDLRNFPKLQTFQYPNATRRECVDKCLDGHVEDLNRCVRPFERNHFDDNAGSLADGTLKIFLKTWHSIAVICFVAFCFSYVCLVLFRYAAIYVIWIINIACVVFVVFLALMFLYVKNVFGAAVMAILAIVLMLLLFWFRKRIQLVAKLFKEASKALMDVPAVMFEPILTLLSLLVSFVIFIALAIVAGSSKKFERYQLAEHHVVIIYKETPINDIAFYLNLFTFIWFTQFIIGCQHFVIAGTISRWYFTRDKTKIEAPIKQSFWHLMRYHLGSICLGSMLITIVKVMRALMAIAKQQSRESKNPVGYFIACCLQCLLDLLEELLGYLVRNAYIIVAKEGTGFMESGKRAYHLLIRNIVDVIALNNFGDIVLGVCRLLIVLIAGFVGYEILDTNETRKIMFIPLLVGVIFAFLIAHCFVTVFEMTVDTIFICYCIDVEENDGAQNPYYMSDSLKKIMTEMTIFAGEHMSVERKDDIQVGPGMADGSCIPMLPQHQVPPVDSQFGGQKGQNLNYYSPPPYPGQQVYQQQPYPQEGYPGASMEYPGQAVNVTGQPMPYPGQPIPYPGQQMQYQGQQQPYPGQNIPYADQHALYPQDTWETEQSEKQQHQRYQQQPYPSSAYPPINYNQQ
ncbi:hypothetical protein ACKWTF_014622 [Chironomus riparius]